MKICIASDAWHPQINGVVTTLSRTASLLGEWGHEILLITPERFRTVACPTYPEIRLSLLSAKAVQQLLGEFAPQAVHIATEGPIGWATRTACRRQRLAFTTSYHTRFPEYLRMRLPMPLSLSYWLIKRFHRSAARTMAAPTILDELRSRGFTNLAQWSRGVDTALFRPREEGRPAPSARPLFITVGRVAREKNLAAFLDLPLPGAKWVVGDGPDLEELRQRYPEVHFTGAKKGEELAAHFAAADVFVFPSLTDTYGIVLLEAMACGVPVAAFPVTGPQYLIRNGINGYTNTDLFTAAMDALKLSRSGCRSFAARFSWDVCTREFFNNLAVNS